MGKEVTCSDLRRVMRRIFEKVQGAQEVLSRHPGLINRDRWSLEQALQCYQQAESLLDRAAANTFVQQED